MSSSRARSWLTTTSAPRQPRTMSASRPRASRSRLFVGSSSRAMGAPRSRMPAIAVSTASPPDSSPTRRSSMSGCEPRFGQRGVRAGLDVPVVADRRRSGAGRRRRTRWRAARRASRRRRGAPRRVARRRVSAAAAGRRHPPSSRCGPVEGSSSPAIRRSSVDLPEPLRPTRPVRPAPKAPETSPRAREPSGHANETRSRTTDGGVGVSRHEASRCRCLMIRDALTPASGLDTSRAVLTEGATASRVLGGSPGVSVDGSARGCGRGSVDQSHRRILTWEQESPG